MTQCAFGLGNVACVSAARLVDEGHEVIGVEVVPTGVDVLDVGRNPATENFICFPGISGHDFLSAAPFEVGSVSQDRVVVMAAGDVIFSAQSEYLRSSRI